jgi:hypothetical protein
VRRAGFPDRYEDDGMTKQHDKANHRLEPNCALLGRGDARSVSTNVRQANYLETQSVERPSEAVRKGANGRHRDCQYNALLVTSVCFTTGCLNDCTNDVSPCILCAASDF